MAEIIDFETEKMKRRLQEAQKYLDENEEKLQEAKETIKGGKVLKELDYDDYEEIACSLCTGIKFQLLRDKSEKDPAELYIHCLTCDTCFLLWSEDE